MFIGRNKELDYLRSHYESKQSELIVFYGRRRVGKTETLNEFTKNITNCFFYSSKEYPDNIQLESFSKTLLTNDNPASAYISKFNTWEDAFKSLKSVNSEEKTLLIIDEFPYMCKSNPAIPSILQILWDTELKTSNIMIVLCGSSMSFIEHELLASKNPLYGRATGIYKMEPMPFEDAKKFFPNYSAEDQVIAYSILGGIPHYLIQFDNSKSLDDNIKNKILTKGTVLYNEVEFLLHQELREVNIYTAIIEAIALGNTRFNDIVTRTKIDTSKLGVYLKSLISLGIVLKEYSALSSFSELSKSNKALYTIKDNFFYFWYAFAYPNLNQLEHDDVEGVYEYLVKPNLRHFAAKTFENICIDYLYKLSKNNKTPFRITNAARWWGKVTKTEEGKKKTYETEIDILSYNEKRDQFILGECKFRNEVFSMEQFVELAGKNIFSSDASYYLFSLVGFQKSLIEKANKEDNIHLISLHDICK